MLMYSADVRHWIQVDIIGCSTQSRHEKKERRTMDATLPPAKHHMSPARSRSHCACAVIIRLPVAAGEDRDKRRRVVSNYRPITRYVEIKQLIVQVTSRREM